MDLTPLRVLLKRSYSYESRSEILAATARLFREDFAERWFFLLLNRVFVHLLDNPDLFHADTADPVVQTAYEAGLKGIDAIQKSNIKALLAAAVELTETYCGIP